LVLQEVEPSVHLEPLVTVYLLVYDLVVVSVEEVALGLWVV
jgi:hypothetical protein